MIYYIYIYDVNDSWMEIELQVSPINNNSNEPTEKYHLTYKLHFHLQHDIFLCFKKMVHYMIVYLPVKQQMKYAAIC